MTDESRERPPEKEERRPGQEAASLESVGKVNGADNATNGAGLSINAHTAWCQPRLCDHVGEIFPALFPDGEIVDGGNSLCVGTVKIDLKEWSLGRHFHRGALRSGSLRVVSGGRPWR